MGLPEKSELTPEELAERWKKKYGDCSTALIYDYVNNGCIKMKIDYPVRFEYDPNTGENKCVGTYVKQVFLLDEVLRFETEFPPTATSSKPGATNSLPKTQEKGNSGKQEKNNRYDALAKILIKIDEELKQKLNRTPQYIEVMNSLKRLSKDRKHAVIQEISEGNIYWKNARGKQIITTIKQLQNRLTRIHKV